MIMTKELFKDILTIAEDNGWGITYYPYDTEDVLEFSTDTPYGQEFNFTIWLKEGNFRELINETEKYIKNFDPDEQAYPWIGKDGHGINGAPYHIKDIVKDMEDAKHMMQELLEDLENKLFEKYNQ